MLPATPQPFVAALAAARGRGVLPTELSSAEVAAVLDADVRRRSILSARTTESAYLEEIGSLVDQLLSPEGRPPGEGINEATARARLQDALDRLGYTPEAGFPGQPAQVPPAEAGGIRDLSSDRRLKLLLETQVRQMAAIGYRLQGDTPAARDAFPCLELVRIYPRRERRNWPLRWGRAGGALHGASLTRMVARKDDPVWNRLGSTELFPDGLGQPYPPFAWNSGMGVRQVPREEAVALGVIKADETPEPVETDVSGERDPNLGAVTAADLDAALAGLDAALTPAGKPLANRAPRTNEAEVARTLANRLVAEAFLNYRADQARHPKGTPGGGRFAREQHFSGDPNFGGSPGEASHLSGRRAQAIEAHLNRLFSGQHHQSALSRWKHEMRVKHPVRAADLVTALHGFSAPEKRLVLGHMQALLDHLPPAMARRIPPFTLRKGPSGSSGHYDHARNEMEIGGRHFGQPTLGMHVWHETMHAVHLSAPDAYKATIARHFRTRTAGEADVPLGPGNGVGREDQWLRSPESGRPYAGRIYRPVETLGAGIELPTEYGMHMSSGVHAAAAVARDRHTLAKVLSIFYHGRRLPKSQ